MKIALLLLMVVFFAILVGLFVMSYKVLTKVRREERQQQSSVNAQLHPKLKQQCEKQDSQK